MPMKEKDETQVEASWKEKLPDVTGFLKRAEQKRWKNKELVLLLILGVLVGFAVKTVAYSRVTIGYQDYTTAHAKGRYAYDINALQKDMLSKSASETSAPQAALGGGGSCGQ